MKTLFIHLVIICFSINFAYAAPTEKRVWHSLSGHKTEAIALKVSAGIVYLKKSNGRVVKVKMKLLTEADQEFLNKHFELNEAVVDDANPKASGSEAATGLPLPAGQLSGPIDAEGSHYYVYIPKTLKKGRKASLLFYTHSGGGGKGKLIKRLADAAETLGWIMAISVESSNKGRQNGIHVAHCLNHILETLPVDKNRIHYSGNSGGAAMAFINTNIMKAFGVMPNVGYIPQGFSVKAKVIYGMGGGYDYNRYLTAYAVSKFKRNGFHRMSPKGHGVGPSDHYMDGMIWMHCKYLKMGKASSDEKEDFEASIINWMNNLKSTNPKRAYSTACIVRDVYKISGANAKLNDAIIKELSADKTNQLYHEGLLDINELSRKRLAKLGKGGNSLKKHFCKEAAKAAEKLKVKYQGVEEIIEVLNAIMKKTAR